MKTNAKHTMIKDYKFQSLHADPYMIWSSITTNSICHRCLNYVVDANGCEFCDVRCTDPEEMTIEELEDVQKTGSCEYFIPKQ